MKTEIRAAGWHVKVFEFHTLAISSRQGSVMAYDSQNGYYVSSSTANNQPFAGPHAAMTPMEPGTQNRGYIISHEDYEQLRQRASDGEQYRLNVEDKERELGRLQEVMKDVETRHAAVVQSFRERLDKMESRNLGFENDNISLRTYIANLKIADAQTKDDAYYIDNLQGLNRMIESSVASVFIDNPSPRKLSNEAGLEILGVLSEFVPSGEFTARLLQDPTYDTIWTLHQDARKRVAFARHLIALFLWDRVFKPFAFGLPLEQSTILKEIEKYIVGNGALPIEFYWRC
jgi:hypothetical protein